MTPTYPGVHIEVASGGVRPIQGVPTSITAFIGRAERGPIDKPVRIQSLADYERQFGGLWVDSTISHSIRHFFENGGSLAIIVRVQNGAVAATFTLLGETGPFAREAANPGSWADNLRIEVDHQTVSPDDDSVFNLVIREVIDEQVIAEEVYYDLCTRPDKDRSVERVI